jgi:pyruvate dehydrogenase E2 component (dihydrolipoamide acetyltransferase)
MEQGMKEMAKPVVMPKLAMAMKQGKVVEWKVAEGDPVEKGQIIMVIETEKVTYDIEAADSGLLHIVAEINATIPVNDVVAWLAETDEELLELQARAPAPAETAEAASAGDAKPTPVAVVAASKGKVKISPAARKMAEDLGVDYTQITGSGPGGRIVKEDVEKAAAAGPTAPPATPAEQWDGEMIDGKRVKQTIPLVGIRAAIAEHMIRSLQTSAQLTTTGEIDMSEMIRIRASYLEKEQQIGVRISFTDMIVFILARVLKEQPMMNSSLIDGNVILWDSVNIGVAVAIELNELETGLIVPVVRDADKKNLVQLSHEIKALSKRARTLQLEPDDLGGSTFTLTNFGVFGSSGYSFSTPVINQPEAAILGTSSITDMAVVRNKEIVIRPIMPLSLTFDHRQLDGAPVGKFLFRFRELMENPHLMFL